MFAHLRHLKNKKREKARDKSPPKDISYKTLKFSIELQRGKCSRASL
jgi:hypothetical protein